MYLPGVAVYRIVSEVDNMLNKIGKLFPLVLGPRTRPSKVSSAVHQREMEGRGELFQIASVLLQVIN
jgi:hypothetical protein